MADKKVKANKGKEKPSITNDQLGENAGQGRIIKESTKSGKNR